MDKINGVFNFLNPTLALYWNIILQQHNITLYTVRNRAVPFQEVYLLTYIY